VKAKWGKFDEKEAKRRRLERWALQAAARDLLPDERVAVCMRRVIPGKKTVDVLYSDRVKRAHYKNLIICARVWICPIDAAKITERRRVELVQAIDGNPDLRPVLITFTLRHSMNDKLPSLLADLLASYRLLKAGKRWQNFRDGAGLVGSIRSLEVTYGDNGWHPHNHGLYFFDRAVAFDQKSVTAFMKDRWGQVLASNSRTATYERGVDVRTAESDVAEYIAKFGHEPVDMKRPGSWTIEREMTKAPAKLARGEKGRSPLQLLADYIAGDKRSGRLFQDYAAAFKGRNQLVWSRGLRARLGLGKQETDEQIAKREDEAAHLLAQLSSSQWRAILANDARGDLLEVASSGDKAAVDAFLLSIGCKVGL
jgi:hypothetical protein